MNSIKYILLLTERQAWGQSVEFTLAGFQNLRFWCLSAGLELQGYVACDYETDASYLEAWQWVRLEAIACTALIGYK